ncbi:MAG: hypothetical protein ACLTZT_03705 [Butyricimonas faecalis]
MRIDYGSVTSACYLDISRKLSRRRSRRWICFVLWGKIRILGQDFTLLTLRCCGIRRRNQLLSRTPYAIDKDFTRFSLEVVASGNKTIISQGKKKMVNGVVTFVNEQELTGITLCIGDYETRTTTIDSIVCELYVFKRASSLFDIIDSYGNSPLEEIKQG